MALVEIAETENTPAVLMVEITLDDNQVITITDGEDKPISESVRAAALRLIQLVKEEE